MICPKGWCLEERLGFTASDAQILYVCATIVLVAVTAYYAWQNKRTADHNARMVNEMRRQVDEASRPGRRACCLRYWTTC